MTATQIVTPVFAATQPAWEVDQGKWKYKDSDGQYKKSTWLRDPSDHRLYHLNADGIMDTGWKLMDGVWYFFTNEHTGYYGAALEKTWAWIDGYCYYFGEDGKMAASCITADGFTVNADGQWTENGKPVYIPGRGYITKAQPAVTNIKHSGNSSSGSSGGSGGSSNKGKNTSQKEETYHYTVRYVTDKGDILASYEGTAAKDSVVSPELKAFDGYTAAKSEELMFHLVSDDAVFQIVYKKNGSLPNVLPTGDRLTGYTVSFITADGKSLGGYASYGKRGETCELETDILAKKCRGYHVASGQKTSWTIGDIGSNDFTVMVEPDRKTDDMPVEKDPETKGDMAYTIRAVGPDNEVLKETTGKANKGDAITLENETFDGYTKVDGQPEVTTLETDGQIFHVFYKKNDREEKVLGKKDETGEKSLYTIYYVATDGTILKKEEGLGTSGEEIAIKAETFMGYEEADGQVHTGTLKPGVSAFTIMYRTKAESKTTLSYTIRYADMDGTVLKETTGAALRGDRIVIPEQAFDGEREIEHQSHEVTLLNDGSVFAIKYEKLRSEDLEEDKEEDEKEDQDEIRDESKSEKTGVDGDLIKDESETLASAARKMARKASDNVTVEKETPEEELLDYRIDFQTEDGETVGSEEGSAKAGTNIKVPELLLDGYEVTDLTSGFELEEDGQNLTVLCEEQEDENAKAVMSEEEIASASEADEEDADSQTPTKYHYMIRYCDRDTGALLMTQTGSAYADSVLTAIEAPSGYVLADHDPFVITADTGYGVNTFTAWCINKQYVKPEGYVDYTIDCVDAAGNIIKTFTDSAKSGSTIRPHYEIYGYDMDVKKEYAFLLSDTNNHFEVLYIPYKIFQYEFRATDIETGDVLFTKTMEGRGGRLADVTLTADDFTWKGYELLSDIPTKVRISSNKENNFCNIYLKKKQEQVDIEELRPYVIHYVSYQDRTKRIFDDKVGIGVVGSQVTGTFLKKVNLPDGTYEAIAASDSMTFTISGQQEVCEFYVYFYKTAEFTDEKTEVNYSIRLQANDTGSVLDIKTGKAYPGTKIYLRNTFRQYAFREDADNFFVVGENADDNYATVMMYRISGNNPERNPHTGKYDGAEWLVTFTDETGNLLLPWRTGFTRKGDVLYFDYPEVIEGADGCTYRAVTASPYIEYVDGTVYRQYNIRYRKGDASENLLEKWEKEAQASLDEIRRAQPCRYTIIYREEDSWNDVGIYTGVATKGETVNIQGISIPGYTLPDDEEKSFTLDEDNKQVVFYVEAIDNDQSMNKYKREFLVRFTDGNGTDVLPPVAGDMAFDGAEAHGYLPVHYPDTFRDAEGNIWSADERGPKQLTTWMLSTNQFEITYHKTFENKFENFYAEKPEDAQRILTEMAVYTVDAKKHSFYVIGRDYNAATAEVSSIVSRYDIANYTTELVDQFVEDGVTYYITRVSFNRVWHKETCTHHMEVTKTVSAGCEVTGMVVKTCSKCGYSETTYYQALGHEDKNHDGMCDNCGAAMKMNIGDEITVDWNPGESGLPAMKLNFICIDTDYNGTGKKLLLCEDGFDASKYGGYSSAGHAVYQSSDLRTFLEDAFMDGLSNRKALVDAGLRNVGLLTKEEYDRYKAQAENTYLFPDGLTILKEDQGEDLDGLVQMSDGSRVTPEEAGTKMVRPIIFMDAGGVSEGVVSGHWKVGDIQSRTIDGKTYLFRCVNDNYKDNSNLDKTMALFLCDTVLPSYTGLQYNEDDSKRDTRFFGTTNNYRYSDIHRYLSHVNTGTGNLVTMDIGIANEYSGSTASGAFENLDDRDLKKHKRDRAQYLESKLYIPSVEEALDMKNYLWKFNRSDTDNVDAVYDGHYVASYWLRTPVYGTDDQVYVVNLKNGKIEPHSVAEEYAIPDTTVSMEYSTDNGNSWEDCADGHTTVPGSGYYLTRSKTAGTSKQPVQSGGMYVLTETDASMEYSVDGGITWATCSDGQTAVGVSSLCLIRNRAQSETIKTGAAVHVLTVTGTDMEWSGDHGATWHACTDGLTVVPDAGIYEIREKSNPEKITEQESVIRYPLSGTETGYEYSDHNADWTGCKKQTTYVEHEGTYVVRRIGAGTDKMAVKQACNVGIRPMYSVYQDH